MHGRKSSQKLAERLMAFIDQRSETANPFNWTSKSVAKVTAKCQAKDSKPLPMAAWNLRSCLAVSRAKRTYYLTWPDRVRSAPPGLGFVQNDGL